MQLCAAIAYVKKILGGICGGFPLLRGAIENRFERVAALVTDILARSVPTVYRVAAAFVPSPIRWVPVPPLIQTRGLFDSIMMFAATWSSIKQAHSTHSVHASLKKSDVRSYKTHTDSASAVRLCPPKVVLGCLGENNVDCQGSMRLRRLSCHNGLLGDASHHCHDFTPPTTTAGHIGE
jgi:hypothetical protein